MEAVHQLEAWRDLFVMLGTSSAALLGLLFVATSLHLSDLVKHPGYSTRARYNNYFLLLTLVEAALILVPQPLAALGAELAIANLMILLITIAVVYRFVYRRRDIGKGGGFSDYRSATFLAAFFAGAVGGVLLFRQSFIGIYIVTAAYVLVIVTVALNAWSIMLGIGQGDRTAQRRSAKRRA
jgi:hypothetical protein